MTLASNPGPLEFFTPDSDSARDNFTQCVVQQMAVPTFALDINGKVRVWNLACARLTGITEAEILNTSNHVRAFSVDPTPTLADLVIQIHPYTGNPLAGSPAWMQVQFPLSAATWVTLPRVSGRRYLSIDAGPIHDEAGRLTGAVQIMHDMTAQEEAANAMQQLASRDGLTGLANRRTFDETLHTEWRRTARLGQPLSLLLVDVDNFKAFNDRHGHVAGDGCLRTVAGVLTSELRRAGDMAARIGGDEFAILLPNLDLGNALILAERLRQALALTAMGSSKFPYCATVSIGVASTIGSQGPNAGGLVEEADKALYRAKNMGRNCVSS